MTLVNNFSLIKFYLGIVYLQNSCRSTHTRGVYDVIVRTSGETIDTITHVIVSMILW